jgi:hypothetical protein
MPLLWLINNAVWVLRNELDDSSWRAQRTHHHAWIPMDDVCSKFVCATNSNALHVVDNFPTLFRIGAAFD